LTVPLSGNYINPLTVHT